MFHCWYRGLFDFCYHYIVQYNVNEQAQECLQEPRNLLDAPLGNLRLPWSSLD